MAEPIKPENKPPAIPPKTNIPFKPPVSVAQSVRDDPSKQKIASQLIQAFGEKLVELNYIPSHMAIQLISVDVLRFLYRNPNATEDEILTALLESIYHHLRGIKGAFIRSVVELAKTEYTSQQNSEIGSNYNPM